MGFLATTLLLAVVRWCFPSVAGTTYGGLAEGQAAMDSSEVLFSDDTLGGESRDGRQDADSSSFVGKGGDSVALGRFFNGKHPILSVPSFRKEFPDTNDLQLTAARHFGVKPVWNREDAEARKTELVYVGSDPYYYVKELSASIPYLVPRASVLLHDIGRNFFDSLQVKHIPLHKIVVTSVLRTKTDVEKLRRRNRNATENSCHLYGTTFDVSYTRYVTVADPQGKPRREVQNDTLKYVLSEVLRDLRNQERCYVKYEVKQSCFHITTR